MLLNRNAEATEALLDFAEQFKGQAGKKKEIDLSWREAEDTKATILSTIKSTEQARSVEKPIASPHH